MRKIFLLLAIIASVGVTGCGTAKVSVSPLSADLAVQNVCIKKNSGVPFEEFLPVVEDGFTRHGISSRVYLDDIPKRCDATVKYNALLAKDLGRPYLLLANIDMLNNNNMIARIFFHTASSFGSGSVKEKIDPLMDEMLVNYPLRK